MTHASNGNTVKVHYTGKIDSGLEFDSSRDREPLEFTIGKGQLIPGFENGVIGMQPGEKKTIRIPADQAYGPHRDDLVVQIERKDVPSNIDPEPGMQVQIRQEDGSATDLVISEVSDNTVTLDANHPLAGQDLTFDIELVEIG